MKTEHFTQNLGNGITLIDSGYMQGGVAAIYLMEQQGKCAIIETGTAHSVPLVLEVLASKGLSTTDVAYVIPTHVHLDHAGGAGELMHHCNQARLLIHPYGARHMINPEKLVTGTKAVYGEEKFNELYGKLRPVDANRVIETAFDEKHRFSLDFNDRHLEFIDTPGHARHHFCVYDKQSKGIFTGDTFGLAYPELMTQQGPFLFATTTPVQFDPDALINSIDRLVSLNPEYMFLTHFGGIHPTPSVVEQLKRTVKKFAEIALDLRNTEGERVFAIQQEIKHYLLDELERLGCKHDRAFCETIIENDTLLNAQGLDFWLSRQIKK